MKTPPLAKIAVFIVALVLAHVGISMLFPAPLPAEVVQFDRYLAEGVDVLYLGDSTLMLPVGEVTTGEILQELLPGRRIGQIAHPAYGSTCSRLRCLHGPHGAGRRRRPAVNFRSFSRHGTCVGLPVREGTPDSGDGPAPARLFLRPLEVFGFFRPSITQEGFLDAPVYDGEVVIGEVRDFEALAPGGVLSEDTENAYREVDLADEETAQAVLTYHYMFKLEPDHRKLDAMIAVAELAAARGVDVIYYITPVNVEQGERFLGPAFSERFADNIRVVQSRLEAAALDNVTLLNLAYDLPAYDLTDTEHLTEGGKEYVAEQVALAIRGGSSIASGHTRGHANQQRLPRRPAMLHAPRARRRQRRQRHRQRRRRRKP